MTNLLVLPADIPFHAYKYATSVARDDDYPEYNLVSSRRDQFFRFGTAAVSNDITFYDTASRSSLGADFMVIARADTLKADGCTQVHLEYWNGAAYATAKNETGMASATLYGPWSNDYVTTFAAQTNRTQWRVSYAGSSSKFRHSKLYFGTAIDFGYDPEIIDLTVAPQVQSEFRGASGNLHMSRNGWPLATFQITWHAITDALDRDFFNKVVRFKHIASVFLYTQTNHHVLNNHRLLHCELVSCESTPVADKKDYKALQCVFRELPP